MSEKKRFTCVICPIGCEIDAVIEGLKIVSMEGNKCKKSEEFVSQELAEPMRVLTSTVRIAGAKWPVIPVRSDRAIPKRLFPRVMRQLSKIELCAPVKMLDTVIEHVADTGANVVATRTMMPEREG